MLTLKLTTKQEEADVFAIRPLKRADGFTDLKYAINSIPPFADFLKAAEQVKGPLTPTAEGSIESPLSMRTITNTVIDLIKFVTKTDNLDPMTREGIPIEQRQLMLSEQGVLQIAIECVQAPFKAGLYSYEDSSCSETKVKLGAAILEHENMGKLAMRLVRHILRGQSANKLAALPHVPSLLELLATGWGASECLTELFTDNDMVDRVPDATIAMFVDLIRQKGRLSRYVKFLEVLCACRGKAVRVNQWRVSRMLLEEAPELLLTIRLEADHILISGHGDYFPKLQEAGGQLDLVKWLEKTEQSTADYFEALTSLYAALVRGRNLRTSPTLQKLLPYKLVCRIITDATLQRRHLDVSRQYVTIARDLWVNNNIYAPPYIHPSRDQGDSSDDGLCQDRPRVEACACDCRESRPLLPLQSRSGVGARLGPIQRVEALCDRVHCKAPVSDGDAYLGELYDLRARPADADLVLTGFYRASELKEIIGPLLSLPDGRRDITGREGDEPAARYEKEASKITVNTVVIMEARSGLQDLSAYLHRTPRRASLCPSRDVQYASLAANLREAGSEDAEGQHRPKVRDAQL